MSKTLIIGMGISAAAYLQSMRLGQDEEVTTLGGPELWGRMEPNHSMGQPAPLLTGNLLSGPRGFKTPPKPGKDFMLAKDFASLLSKHIKERSKFTLPGDWVKHISREGSGKYLVEIQGPDVPAIKVEFDKVIIAAGPGPNRPLMAGDDGKAPVDVKSMAGHVVAGTDFMSPDWKMPGSPEYSPFVAVYGGSATAAWAVELAILRRMHVTLWFTRRGEGQGAWDANKRFSEAFPAGERNTGVEEDTKNIRQVLALTDVRFHKLEIAHSFVMLELKDEGNNQVRHPVDLLIYALGSAHAADAGLRQILASDIQRDLVPYYDRNFAISSKPALLAVGAVDGSLMIVGSAMSSSGGFNLKDLSGKLDKEEKALIGDLAQYKDISDSLPPAARPTEGIAMVMSGIEALNTFIPAKPKPGGRVKSYTTPTHITAVPTGKNQPMQGSLNPEGGKSRTHELDFEWNINFNTSNRTQLATFLAQTTDLSPLAANLAVMLLVRLRGKSGNPLGLTEDQAMFIIGCAAWCASAQEKYNQGLEERRKKYDHNWGADWYLNVLADVMTTSPELANRFTSRGIQVK
jgi:hypothetical protein